MSSGDLVLVVGPRGRYYLEFRSLQMGQDTVKLLMAQSLQATCIS